MIRKLFLLPLLLFTLQANSQSINELLKKADKLVKEKKHKEALTIYQQAWKKDSTNYDLYMDRGSLYLEMKDPENAFYDFTKAVDLKPDSAQPYHHRAISLYAMMYTEEAIMDNTKAIELSKNDTLRMMSFMNRGTAKQQKRDFQGAYEDYFRASQYNPNDIGVLNNIATTLDELGRVDEALEYLHKIIKIDSSFIGSYVNLGFQYTKLKRYKEAIAFFDKALLIDKNDPLTLNNRGLALYHLKDYKRALADINQSLSIYPSNAYAYKNRALVYIAQEQKEKACTDLKKALDLGFRQMYGDEVDELQKENCK